jgi:hypothetical protein
MAPESKSPDDERLDVVLGPLRKHWDALLVAVRSRHPELTLEWKRYSIGWRLVIRSKRRNVAYLNPAGRSSSVTAPSARRSSAQSSAPRPAAQRSFLVSFALGEGAVQAAEQSRLPKRILALVRESKRFPEGRAVRVDVASAADVAHVLTLVALQLQHG